MTKPNLLLTCPAFPEVLEQLSLHFDIESNQDELSINEDQLIQKLYNKQAAFTAGNARFTARAIRSAPQLKIISAMTVGYDNIDVASCAKQGIVVTNTPEVINQTTADFAWALLLATARRVTEADIGINGNYAASSVPTCMARRWVYWEWDGSVRQSHADRWDLICRCSTTIAPASQLNRKATRITRCSSVNRNC